MNQTQPALEELAVTWERRIWKQTMTVQGVKCNSIGQVVQAAARSILSPWFFKFDAQEVIFFQVHRLGH